MTEPNSPPPEESTSPAESVPFEAAEPTLEEQLAQALRERDDVAERAVRMQAEFENTRKRMQREAELSRQFAVSPFAADLLPCLDNLQRAVDAGETTGNLDELLKGLRMVSSGFSEALAKHGVKPIPAQGVSFDPNLHQAIQQVPSTDVPAMQVIQEVERGWQLHDRVIRPSMVIVSSGPPAAE
jgi:molecular chaperone GrpE